MKTSFALLIVLALSIPLFSQNKTLGVGAGTPNPNAALHVESPTNNQGFIMPRLTTVQRSGMASLLTATDLGLMLYDTDLKTIYVWDGTVWKSTAQVAGGQKLSYPYKDSVTTNPPVGVNDVFALKYNGTSNARVMRIESLNPTNLSSALSVLQQGRGLAGYFEQFNDTTSTSALTARIRTNRVQTGLAPVAVYGESTGTGALGGAFWNINPANNYPALYSRTLGTGNAASFEIVNAANTAPALFVQTNGTGNAGTFKNTNAANNNGILYAETNTSGSGTAIQGINSGTSGYAGFFEATNPASTSNVLQVNNQGLGLAGSFANYNASNNQDALYAQQNGSGNAFTGITIGTGRAGYFGISNAANSANAIMAETNGTGSAAIFNHTGASGNLAIFQNSSSNVARIDKTGKGFFNGGTQNSGADLAEMFDVEGSKSEYEPGDVLVISESTDRTIEKCSSPNSTRVAGVYATKPGVILTEKDINSSLDELVPMGVIGVIPTKVCMENGPIKRGDLLSTSSLRGYAMKAKPILVNGIEIYATGTVLGKALENFSVSQKGMIKVLVNVK